MEKLKGRMTSGIDVFSDSASRDEGASAELGGSRKLVVGGGYTAGDFAANALGVDGGEISSLLRFKSNLIMQGAPGVGKTFVAKHLAYLIMHEVDPSRIMNVQFHASYTYESFVAGLFPDGNGGFYLREGELMKVCKRAAEDPERPYFLIIDEINRGNTSAIFGEIFSLMEREHRGESMVLKYDALSLSIPKNLYIIGTMNTADRGLQALDYALRRRFAFYTVLPAYGSPAFLEKMRSYNCPRLMEAISAMQRLNAAIADDPVLGPGYMVGHSYWFGYKTFTSSQVEDILKYEICPLLQEYWFDRPEVYSMWEHMLGVS